MLLKLKNEKMSCFTREKKPLKESPKPRRKEAMNLLTDAVHEMQNEGYSSTDD